MKSSLIISALLLSVLILKAQDNGEQDTLKIKWKGSKIWIFEDKQTSRKDSIRKAKKEGKNFTHWGGLDIGICALSTGDNKLHVSSEEDVYNTNYFLDLKYNRSWYFSLNLFEKNIRLYKNYMHGITGFGVEWNSYNFRKNIVLNPDAPSTNSNTVELDTTAGIKYIKNQLKVAYIKIPLLLEFNTNPHNAKKSFHLAGGIEFAYRIDSWTKRKFELNGDTYRVKRKTDYNLNTLKYGAALRAGYGDFTLFFNYYLSPLFDGEKGPENPVYPLSVGIALTF